MINKLSIDWTLWSSVFCFTFSIFLELVTTIKIQNQFLISVDILLARLGYNQRLIITTYSFILYAFPTTMRNTSCIIAYVCWTSLQNWLSVYFICPRQRFKYGMYLFIFFVREMVCDKAHKIHVWTAPLKNDATLLQMLDRKCVKLNCMKRMRISHSQSSWDLTLYFPM